MADIFDELDGGVAVAPAPAKRDIFDDLDTTAPAPVAKDIFDDLEAAPVAPRRKPSEALQEALTQAKLLPSATSALNVAADKGIRRKPDGDWDLPIMAPLQDNFLVQGIAGATVSGAQKSGARLDSAGMAVDKKAIQKVFHDFQQANNLSDEEVAAAWSDLGNQNRKWEPDEKARVLSDGTLLPNVASTDWLDGRKAAAIINNSAASEASKAAARANIGEIQGAIANHKADAYREAFKDDSLLEKIDKFNPISAPGNILRATTRPDPFDEVTKNVEGDMTAKVKAYENYLKAFGPAGAQINEFAAAWEAGKSKVGQTVLGLAGAAGIDAAGNKAAEMAKKSALLKEGAGVEGLVSSTIEELPSLAVQIALTRGVGAGAAALGAGTKGVQLAGNLAAFTTAGGQSAGLTYAQELADGATPEEARKKAVKSGITTALVTAAFGTGSAGGVERVAAGKHLEDITVRDLVSVAREKGVGSLVKSPELRKFAGDIAKASGGEFSEEGLDQLLGTFASADPNTKISDAWDEAWQAAKTGGFIGGALHPVAGALESDRDAEELIQGATTELPADSPTAAAANEPLDTDEERVPSTEETALPEVQEAALAPGSPAEAEALAPALEEGAAGGPVVPRTKIQEIMEKGALERGTLTTDAEGNVIPVESPPNENALPAPTAEEDQTLDRSVGKPAPAAGELQSGVPPVPSPEVRKVQETLPADPNAYSKENLAKTFDLTPEQADATDALVQAMGLDTSRILLKKGGTPGTGLQESGPKPQGIKGSFERLAENGKALLRGLSNPDVTTGIHEISHVARQTLFDRETPQAGITPEDITVAEDWAGAKDGKWDTKAEEKFARGFERYLRDGEAPVPELESVFAKIADWFRNIYQTLKGSPIDIQISPEMKAVFDRLVTRGKLPESVSQQTVEEAPVPDNQEVPISVESGAPPEEPDLTSTKNAATDAELEKMGFDPIAAPASRALGTAWAEALAITAADPTRGRDLVDELNRSPRALTDDVENGILLDEVAKRKAAYGQAQEAFKAAEASGDQAATDEAQVLLDRRRDAMYSAITAAKATGSAWGRSGRFRQIAIDEDYSIVQMEAKYRTEVNEGKPITAEQAKEVEALHKKIADAEKALADYKQQVAEEEARRIHEADQAARKKARPKIRKAIAAKLDAAKQRLQAEGFLPPDPETPAAEGGEFLAQKALPDQTLEDLGTIGASWMVDKELDLKVFKNRLKRVFGDKAVPYAEAIYAKAKEILNTAADAGVQEDAGEAPVKRKSKTEILEGIEDQPSGNDIFQLARLHVNAGVEGFENVMNAVMADLKDGFPDLTLREVHDAYSGYGKTIFPSKQEDLVKLREYRTLARLTSQLEDASKKVAPMRTGLQRDKASERVRTLQKEVKEMMRKMGIKTAGSKNLTTSLDAVKNRLRNEIEELDAAIAAKTPKPERSAGPAYDAEATALKAQRDARKKEYDALFPKKGKSDDVLIEEAIKSLDRRIAENEKLIREGKAKKDVPAKRKVTSQGITDRQARLKELVEQRRALRDVEAERLERTKKLTANRIAKIKERITKNDYSPAAKRDPVKPDAELGALQREEIKVKREFNEKLLDAQLARRSKTEKVFDMIGEIFNASRSIITSGEVSAVLRQGGFLVFGHPIRAAKMIVPMFKAGFNEAYAQAMSDKIKENDYYVLADKAGLFLSDFGDSHHFHKMEEAYRGRLAKKIPYVKHLVNFSERTYTAFLNQLRMETFESMVKGVSPTGQVTQGEAEVIANFVNIATGRGKLPKSFEKAADAMATVFFSPRYVVSRFELLAMPMTGFSAGRGSSARTRKAIATEYGRTLAAASLVIGLALMWAGDDDDDEVSFETDARSSDFGKIKIGNTRVDLFYGLLQATVFLRRLQSGQTKGKDGEIQDLRGEDAKFGKSVFGTIGTFVRSKLAPMPGGLVNLLDGKDVVGNKVFWETELIGNLTPMTYGDIWTAMEEQGIPKGTALGLLLIFGAGASTYSNEEDLKPMEQRIATGVFQVDPERYEDE